MKQQQPSLHAEGIASLAQRLGRNIAAPAAAVPRLAQPSSVQAPPPPSTPDAVHNLMTAARKMGVPAAQIGQLVGALARRDAEGDDRRLCLECANLDTRSRVCGTPCRAGIAPKGYSAPLGPDWVTLLQRCPGFTPHT